MSNSIWKYPVNDSEAWEINDERGPNPILIRPNGCELDSIKLLHTGREVNEPGTWTATTNAVYYLHEPDVIVWVINSG